MRNIFRRAALKRWAPPVSLAGTRGRRRAGGAARDGAPSRGVDDDRRRAFALGPGVRQRSHGAAGPHDATCTCWRSTTCTARSSRRPEPLRPVRRRRGVPREGGQGPPGAVRRLRGDGLRRRQHRRQPARERALPRGADHDRLEPDARRLRARSATTSSTRAAPSCCASRTAAAIRRRLHRLLRTRWPTAAATNVYPGRRLPVPVGERGRSTRPARRCSRPTGSSSSSSTDGKRKFKVGFIGEVLQVDADDRDADRRRRAHVPGRGRRGQPGRRRARRARA